MREMKDSGIEWIGEIPKGWDINNLGNITNIYGRIGFRGYTTDDLVDIDEGPITLSPSNIVNQKLDLSQCSYISWEKYEESPEIKVFPNDIILVKTASVGKCAIFDSNEPATLNPQLIVFKNIKGNHHFVYYCLICDVIQVPIILDNLGSVIPTITQHNIKHYHIPFPSLAEQSRIASFLDSKCSEIDSLHSDINEQIETLKEYKKSVITEAVTKGLDPDVEMKDSGVEGIEKIPLSWERIQLEHCATIVRGGSPRPIEQYMSNSNEGYNWIKIGDTTKGVKFITHAKEKIVKSGLYKTRMVHSGDLLLTNSMSFGEPYILSGIDGCIHDGWLAFSKINFVDKTFLYYILVSNACRVQFEKSSDGGVVQNLNIDKVKHTIIYYPQKEEQLKIVAYLDSKCSEIDSIIESKQQQLETLEQYKKSLIYEYVTGKKEVPANA